jgi:hypothetical protein
MPTVKRVEVPDRDEDQLARWVPIVVPALAVLMVFLVYVIMAGVE